MKIKKLNFIKTILILALSLSSNLIINSKFANAMSNEEINLEIAAQKIHYVKNKNEVEEIYKQIFDYLNSCKIKFKTTIENIETFIDSIKKKYKLMPLEKIKKLSDNLTFYNKKFISFYENYKKEYREIYDIYGADSRLEESSPDTIKYSIVKIIKIKKDFDELYCKFSKDMENF